MRTILVLAGLLALGLAVLRVAWLAAPPPTGPATGPRADGVALPDAPRRDTPLREPAAAPLAPDRAPVPVPAAELGAPPIGLRVRVVNEFGAGVPEVQLRATERRQHGGDLRFLGDPSTDVEGRARLGAPTIEPAERCEVTISVLPPDERPSFQWKGPVPEGELVLELLRGARISGTVGLASGEAPPPGTRVCFYWREGEHVSGSACADVEDDHFATQADARGHVARAGLAFRDRGQVVQDLDLRVRAGAEHRVDLVFDLGCDCVVTVFDEESGVPVAGAEIHGYGVSRARTDERGRVRLPGAVQVGEARVLRVEHPDHPELARRVECPFPPRELSLELRLPRGHALGGVVVDARGQPLPGLGVRCGRDLSRSVYARPLESATTTDSDGRFHLSGLSAADDWDIVFHRGTEVLGVERVSLPAAEERERWVVADPLATEVRVFDARGRPVEGAGVLLSDAARQAWVHGTTDERGAVTLHGLFPGRWGAWTEWGPPLDPERPGLGRKLAHVDLEVAHEGAPDVELRLPPPREEPWEHVPFVLHVRDAETGAPVEWLTCVAVEGVDCSSSDLQVGRGGEEGFHGRLLEGTYDVAVDAEDYAPGYLRIELRPGSQPTVFELDLEPEG